MTTLSRAALKQWLFEYVLVTIEERCCPVMQKPWFILLVLALGLLLPFFSVSLYYSVSSPEAFCSFHGYFALLQVIIPRLGQEQIKEILVLSCILLLYFLLSELLQIWCIEHTLSNLSYPKVSSVQAGGDSWAPPWGQWEETGTCRETFIPFPYWYLRSTRLITLCRCPSLSVDHRRRPNNLVLKN